MSAKRIAIVRHSFYPSELNVKREAEALRDAGYEVDVICLRGEDEATCEDIEGIHVHRLPVGHRRGKILRYIWEYNAFFALASAKLARLHAKHRYAAVQVNTMPDYLVFVALFPKLSGARVVLHLHEPVPELFGTMFPARWYTRPFLWTLERVEQASIKFADRAITVTDQMRDNFVRRGADPTKIAVVVNVPDDRYFRIENYRTCAARSSDEARGACARRVSACSPTARSRSATASNPLFVRWPSPGARAGIEFRFMGGGDHLRACSRSPRSSASRTACTISGFVPFEQMVEEILLADVCVVAVERIRTRCWCTPTRCSSTWRSSDQSSCHGSTRAAYMTEDAALYFESGNAASSQSAWSMWRKPAGRRGARAPSDALYLEHRWENEKATVSRSVL
jgi:hypothetical protein